MTTKIKAIIGTIISVILLCGGTLYYYHEPPLPLFGVADQVTDIATLKTTIENDRQPNGKYKRKDKELMNGVEYEVHEYKNPQGEMGYQIFMRTDEYIKSIGYGVEAEQRIYEIILPPKTATTTE